MEYITDIPGAPPAIGPYSRAVVSGQLVFLSGQIPLDPKTGKIVEGNIEDQTKQVFSNIRSVLAHLGLSFKDVAKATVFVTNLADFQKINAIYEQAMEGVKPARSTVQVAALPMGAQIEIEVIAVRG